METRSFIYSIDRWDFIRSNIHWHLPPNFLSFWSHQFLTANSVLLNPLLWYFEQPSKGPFKVKHPISNLPSRTIEVSGQQSFGILQKGTYNMCDIQIPEQQNSGFLARSKVSWRSGLEVLLYLPKILTLNSQISSTFHELVTPHPLPLYLPPHVAFRSRCSPLFLLSKSSSGPFVCSALPQKLVIYLPFRKAIQRPLKAGSRRISHFPVSFLLVIDHRIF